jgi:hypothetical protein
MKSQLARFGQQVEIAKGQFWGDLPTRELAFTEQTD